MWNLDYMDLSEEERRRRTALGPDREEQEDQVTPINTAPATPTVSLTPAQQKYKAELDRLPNQGDYKPSKWRRFGAALAGGLAGLRNPEMGARIAQDIIDVPYENAMDRWQRSLSARAAEAGLEERAMAQDIARRRAGAYEQQVVNSGVSADAAWQRAITDATYRQHLMNQPQAWKPTTKAEAQEQESWKHPLTYGGFGSVDSYRNAHKPFYDPNDLEATRQRGRREIEGIRQGGANARNAARIKAGQQGRPVNPASPMDQLRADHIAVQNVIRKNPQFKAFYKPSAEGLTGGHIMDASELPQAGGGFLGFGGVSQAEAATQRTLYNQFLQEWAREKRAILGRRSPEGLEAPGSDDEDDGPWDIQEEDEEDQ